jgi:diguanylate cyclase (GGDEF)-like protein/PAS domain S-box-containing protein
MADPTKLDIFRGVSQDFYPLMFDEVQDGVLCLDRKKSIVYVNGAAARVLGCEGAELVGKPCPDDPPLYTDLDGTDIGPGENPVDLVLKDGKARTMFAYVRTKIGYRTPVILSLVPIVKDGGSIAGVIELISDASPKAAIPFNLRELEKMGLVDVDTGIAGRAYLEMTISQRLAEFQKYGVPFGLIYTDVDNHTKITEKYGRLNASKIVRTVARTLQKNIRYFDIVGRWDEEEFLVVLLNIDESRLDIVANKLRLLVSESYFATETGMLNATVSMGASVVQRYDSAESLIKRTEQLMQHSKWLGKNKVSMSFVQKDLV